MKNDVFYVYKLIDPRTNTPFYVGKGYGERINNYIQRYPKVNEYTRTRIEEIALSGNVLQIQYVSESLSEQAATKLETQLINQYGRMIKDAGGILTNVRSSDHTRIFKNSVGSRYTTIQVTKNMNHRIKKYCKETGLVSSTITERLWDKFLSGSIKL